LRLVSFLPLFVLIGAAFIAWALVPWTEVAIWAAQTQRVFQDAMAVELYAVRRGETAAILALCTATAAYGFVHALGPGHGKVLLGGAALASGATLKRMTWLTIISSLAQSGSAIALVGGLVVVFGVTSAQLGPIADDWLAPASSAAIAALGAYLIWRGFQQWRQSVRETTHHHGHDHHTHCGHDHDDHGACCGHAHGPSLKEVETLSSFRDALFLVLSIAMRPCTGAIFGVAARKLSAVQDSAGDNVARIAACVQMIGGAIIMFISMFWLMQVFGTAL